VPEALTLWCLRTVQSGYSELKMNKHISIVVVVLLIGMLPGVVMAQGGPAPGEVFTWDIHGLSVPYPAGWTTQSLSDEIVALLGNPADVAVFSDDAPPLAPVLAVVVTSDEDFFGADTVSGDLSATAENWLANSDIPEPMPVVDADVAGLAAVRVRGVNTVNTGFVDGHFAYLPDGRLLVLIALVPADQYKSFSPTLDSMIAGVSLQAPAQAAPVALAIQPPNGWISRVVSDDDGVIAIAYAGTEADLDAVASAVAPATAGVLFVVADAPEQFFGNNMAGDTIRSRAENWSANFFDTALPLQTTTLGDLPAVVMEGYRANGETHFVMVMAEHADGRVIVVTALTPEGQEEAFYSDFTMLLGSFSQGGLALSETLVWDPFDIAISYPAGWSGSMQQEGVYAVMANAADNLNDVPSAPAVLMIVLDAVSSESLDVPLDALLESIVTGQMGGTDLEIYETTVAGFEAFRTRYSESNGSLLGDGLIVRTDDYTLLMLAVAPPMAFAGFMPTYEAMLGTLAVGAAGEVTEETLLSETFRWPERGFAIDHPAGWRMELLEPGLYVLLSNPADDPRDLPTAPALAVLGAREYMEVSPTATAEDVVNEFAASELGVTPGEVALLSYTVDGLPAAWLTAPIPDTGGYQVVLLAVVADQETFMLTFISPPGQIDVFSDVLEAMIDSVVIDR
jgi:hypothetical protein